MRKDMKRNIGRILAAFMALTLLCCPVNMFSNNVDAAAPFDGFFGNCTDDGIYHKTGFEQNNAWHANVTQEAGFMVFGPYKSFRRGFRNMSFSLMIDYNCARMLKEFGYSTNDIVCYLDVYDSTTDLVLARKAVYRGDFKESLTYQYFSVNYYNPSSTDKLEFRIYYCANSGLWADQIAA